MRTREEKRDAGEIVEAMTEFPGSSENTKQDKQGGGIQK